MYDTCLGNPCKSGEVCETKKDRSVFCVKDQENMQVGDCTELFEYRRKSGIYTIYPSKADEGVKVFCNMTNGGWTVIQRRIDGEENFHRNWVEYENGFGELQHEFWLGNKYLHLLTTSGKYKLRVELVHNNGTNVFAEYQNFQVEDAASKYRIVVNGYSGYAGYYMHAYNYGRYFSTYDSDNDAYAGSCMNDYGYGAWWIGQCNGYPDLNNKNITIVRWDSGYNIKSISDMMIQRK